MKKIFTKLIIGAFFSINFSLYSQEEIIINFDLGHEFQKFEVNNKNVKHGDFKQYGFTGFLEQEGKYHEGEKTGLWKYYSRGMNWVVDFDKVDKFHKAQHFLYKDGTIYIKGRGKVDFELSEFKFLKNIKLNEHIKLYDGKLFIDKPIQEGSWDYFDINNQLITQAKYSSGKEDGIWKYYDQNGLIEVKIFKNGDLVNDGSGNMAAQFPGGNKNIMRYIQKKMHYPDLKHVKGKVTAQFTIDKEGNVINPKIIKSLHSKIDKAILDVFRQMPKWLCPGQINGVISDTIFEIPIIIGD